MKLSIKNISGSDIFLDFYGGTILNTATINLSDTDLFMDEICESQELKDLITNAELEAYNEDGVLTIKDALRHLQNHTALQNEENERYQYREDEKVILGRNTQLRIEGRALNLLENSEIDMQEGSDIIIMM